MPWGSPNESPMNTRELLSDQFLIMACYAIGAAFILGAWLCSKGFDTCLGFGMGISAVALFYSLVSYFREQDKN